MAESRYEKYITRKPAIIVGPGPDGVVRFEVPKTDKIPLTSDKTTGPRLIFSNDVVKEATTKVEYGFIMKDITLLNDKGKNYGAHKHDYAEIFLFTGNDPYDTNYLGGEGEFWLGEGPPGKIKFYLLQRLCTAGCPFPCSSTMTSPINMGVVT
jgi:hypothetical protein